MQLTIYEPGRQPYTVNLEEFHKDTISFGRHPESDIVMHPDFVSWVHGCIYQENGQWYIEDVGSTYGLYCNGQRIKRMALHDGVQLVIPYGTYELQMFFSETQEDYQSAGHVYGTIPQDQYDVQNPVHSNPEFYRNDAGQPFNSEIGSVAAHTAASTAKQGIMHTTAAKVALAIGVVALAGGVAAGVLLYQNSKQRKQSSTEITQTKSEVSEAVNSTEKTTTENTTTEKTTTEKTTTERTTTEATTTEAVIDYTLYDPIIDQWLQQSEAPRYAISDLDGDGVDELILGYYSDYEVEGVIVNNIYSIRENAAEQVYIAADHSYGFNCYCCENARICISGWGVNGWVVTSAYLQYGNYQTTFEIGYCEIHASESVYVKTTDEQAYRELYENICNVDYAREDSVLDFINANPDKYQKISEQELRDGENAHQMLELDWKSAR